MEATELSAIIARLRTLGRDEQMIEVKSSTPKLPKTTGETLSAFANGSGGLLLLGLDECDGFRPVPGFLASRVADALANEAANKLTPPVRPLIAVVPFEGSQIVAAKVPGLKPQEKPCYVTARGMYQGSYTRTFDGDRRLSYYEVDRLMENRTPPRADQEAVTQATLDDLDPRTLKAYLDRERETHARLFSRVDAATARSKLGVTVVHEGVERPTIAGLMAFGIFPQQFFPQLMVSFAVFSGSEKASALDGTRFLDSGTVVGPIPAMVADGVQVVARNMRTRSVITGSTRRDLPDYSLIAVREALTNALMHRDYSPPARGTQVQMNLYADRLEITNPGGLYGIVTIDSLGTQGVSSSRNEYLARLLEGTPYDDGGYVAENRGSGYTEILAQQERNLLQPPIPRDSLVSFSLTFPRRSATDAEVRASRGHSTRDAIMTYLTDHRTANVHELSAASGITPGGTRRVLSQLMSGGLVERMEPARSPRQRYRRTSHTG